MPKFAIIDNRNDWYSATDDDKQVVPVGHRIIPIDEAATLSRSYKIRESVISISEFYERLTDAELKGLYVSVNPTVIRFRMRLQSLSRIDLDGSMVVNGLAFLVGLALLTVDRVAVIRETGG